MPLIRDLPNKEYHAKPGLSSSGLGSLAKSPAHYLASKEDQEETKALKFGTAFHTYVLEPEKFQAEIAVAPKVDRRTKAGKTAWIEFVGSAADKTIIDEEDMETIKRMGESVYAHPEAMRLLDAEGFVEVSCFWDDYTLGAPCKCRPDKLNAGGACIDLKSTEDASQRAFARSCGQYNYIKRAAFYLRGLSQVTGYPHTEFYFIAVEKKAPYGTMVYQVPRVYLDIAAEELDALIALYGRCIKDDLWPGYLPEVEQLTMPAWAL